MMKKLGLVFLIRNVCQGVCFKDARVWVFQGELLLLNTLVCVFHGEVLLLNTLV